MENRFGIKDLILAVLLIALLVSVWLAMNQFDRQFERVQRIDQKLDQQTNVQAQMQRKLDELSHTLLSGVAVAPINTSRPADDAGGKYGDPFARLKAAQTQPGYAQGDWCIDALGANVAKITPLVSVDVYGAIIQGYVLESLATRDPNTFEFQPLLAKGWKIEENLGPWRAYVEARMKVPLTEAEVLKEEGIPGADKPAERAKYIADRLKEGRRRDDVAGEAACPFATRITFDLRRNVDFSDGQPLTAQDFVFSYNLIMNPKLDAPREREQVRSLLKGVEAPDDYTVVFTFKKPYFESFGMAAGMNVLPRHFYGRYTPEEINKEPGLLLGSGPYRMQSPTGWSPGKLLVLVRNERYWGTQAAFDRLVFHEVNLETTRATMFQNREIDLFAAQPEQYKKMLTDRELLKRTQHFEYESVTGGYGFIAWNQRRGGKPTLFADKRVRQAMTMMIDRERLFRDILLGYGIEVTGPFNRLSPQYDHSVKPWPFDIERAKALLKDAGYFDRDGDGTIDGPDGQPFKFKVLFPGQTGFWDRVLLMLKDNLAKAGVIMELEPIEWSVFDARVKGRDFDALCMAWSGGIESDIWQMFHSSQIANAADNFTSYRNPELDRLIDEARESVDEKKRMPLWQACHRILHEDQPYTFLYSRKATMFIDGRIRNVEQTKMGLNDRTEWFVPAALQIRKE
jgi:peptide/nickel transport system substrate-binding protein